MCKLSLGQPSSAAYCAALCFPLNLALSQTNRQKPFCFIVEGFEEHAIACNSKSFGTSVTQGVWNGSDLEWNGNY